MRRAALLTGLLGAVGACGGADVNASDDSDRDGIQNQHEAWRDDLNTDGDEWPDWLDLDSDGDGIPDAEEAGDDDPSTEPIDTDSDGTPDFQDTDSDGDGLPDDGDPDVLAALDSDEDGTPDFEDEDDDGDGLSDRTEGGDVLDSDGDGVSNRLDDDSDGDGVSDEIEGAVDTDDDGSVDFLDLDSDGDGLSDDQEDLDGDGTVTDCGTERVPPCETDRLSDDTDGDGVPDLVESVAGTDGGDPESTIPETDFYFVLPFEGPTEEGTLEFSTNLRQADIFFSVDTTGSFGEEIAAIQATIESAIVPGVGEVIPSAAFGVGRFEDFPIDPFGLPSDLPFELVQAITTDVPTLTDAVNLLDPAAGGLDTPEAGVEALFQWATGHGIPEAEIDPFAPGDVGGAGFRTESLPIIVQVTDARSHEPADYTEVGIATRSLADATAALNAIGARVIGIRSTENDGTSDDPREELETLATATRAIIPATADECATGIDGAAVPATGGMCPLVFDVRPDGTGLGSIIVDAIAQLASLSTLDISAEAVGETMGVRGETLPAGTTTADFIESISPEPPAPAGSTIEGDIFRGVTPGSTVRFRLVAHNDFVPHTPEPQLFTVDIHVLGDAVTVLDVRRVFIIVPREIEIFDIF